MQLENYNPVYYNCRLTIAAVWSLAAVYSIPHLIAYDVVSIRDQNNTAFVHFCMHSNFNFAAYDTATFAVWYVAPLALITFMYTKISLVLWQTSKHSTFKKVPTGPISYSKHQLDGTSCLTVNLTGRKWVKHEEHSHSSSGGNDCHDNPRGRPCPRESAYNRHWEGRLLRNFRESHQTSLHHCHHHRRCSPQTYRPSAHRENDLTCCSCSCAIIAVTDCKACSSPRTLSNNHSPSPKRGKLDIAENVCKKNRRQADREDSETESSFSKNLSASSSGGSASHCGQRSQSRTVGQLLSRSLAMHVPVCFV